MCKISDGWIADIPNWTVLKRIYEFFFVILSPYAFPSFNNICRPLTPFNHLCVLLVHFCSAFLLCKKKTQKVLVVMVAFVWTMLLLLLSLVASTFNITLRVCEQSETIFQLKLTFFFCFFSLFWQNYWCKYELPVTNHINAERQKGRMHFCSRPQYFVIPMLFCLIPKSTLLLPI